MSDYLCIRVSESELTLWSVVSWAVVSPTAQIMASGMSLLKDLNDEVPESEQARRSLVIVPSESVLLKSAAVAPGQQRHLKQILPFVVEEFIIDPIENMHLATPVLHSGSHVAVACVKRSSMHLWVDTFEQVGIQADYMFCDVLCVPQYDGNHWSLLVDGAKVLFRDAKQSGMVLDEQSAESILGIAITNSHATESSENIDDATSDSATATPEQVTLISVAEDNQNLHNTLLHNAQLLKQHAEDEAGTLDEFNEAENPVSQNDQASAINLTQEPDQLLDEELSEVSSANLESYAAGAFVERLDRYIRSENIETQNKHYSETAAEFLMISSVQSLESGLNLLQGDFKAISAGAESRRFIRKISISVAACLSLFLLLTLAGGGYLNYRADQYFDQSVTIYRSLFPSQRRVRNPVREMKNRLKGGSLVGARSEFLPLLDAASKSLASLDPNSEVETSITQLRYDTQRGQIAVDIRVGNIDQLEVYRDALIAEGLSVDILSANRDGEVINGRIQIGRS